MRAVRPIVWCVAAVSLAVGLASTTPDAVLLAADTARLVLNLHFTGSDSLSAVSERALMVETESIWTLANLHVKWLREPTDADPGPTLRVLVMARAAGTATDPLWTVGELLQADSSRPIAIASTLGARRVVAESRWNRLLEQPALYDHRLGLVLGRAVAHEIGHYVLGTNTHATRGLMRARIDAREFADVRAGSFRLDDDAQAFLATVAAQGNFSREMTSGFSYSTR